jgi:hypothetical protein
VRTHSLFLGPAFDRLGIDHDGPHISVAQKLLDGLDVVVGLEQVAGKAVPESVGGDPLWSARPGGPLRSTWPCIRRGRS